jgi:succinoglycan biosynthesis transport protein ExoP
VELRSASRVTSLQKAEPPEFPDQRVRMAVAGLAGMLCFFLPVGLILWRDARAERINSSWEVARLTGLEVIGAVPVIPLQAVRQLAPSDGATKRQHYWRALVAESVNRIAARLLYTAKQTQLRVILVTSAVGGEGKTTLATQLALSLARTGHRTLLVDFDLRRPSVDKVFDLPLQPGICEALRNDSALAETVRPTNIDNLLVLTAGRPDRTTLRSMANSSMQSLFTELRELGEYIVVDGCPILPVADIGFISGYVDATVLAVLRDVSQAPRIRAAVQALNAVGARVLGAVVTESAGDAYYHVYNKDASSRNEDVAWSRAT